MTTFNEMNPKELRQARNDLVEYMYPLLRVSRVINLTDSGVMLEGGKFPATYDVKKGELTVWSRSKRNAGASMTVDELVEAEKAVKRFYEKYQQRGDEES